MDQFSPALHQQQGSAADLFMLTKGYYAQTILHRKEALPTL
jgi:hypothetical protein